MLYGVEKNIGPKSLAQGLLSAMLLVVWVERKYRIAKPKDVIDFSYSSIAALLAGLDELIVSVVYSWRDYADELTTYSELDQLDLLLTYYLNVDAGKVDYSLQSWVSVAYVDLECENVVVLSFHNYLM